MNRKFYKAHKAGYSYLVNHAILYQRICKREERYQV